MPDKKERFTTTLDSQLLEEIKILAIKKKRSTNILIEDAIRSYLEENKEDKPDKYPSS